MLGGAGNLMVPSDGCAKRQVTKISSVKEADEKSSNAKMVRAWSI
jgi:hypothetical protein